MSRNPFQTASVPMVESNHPHSDLLEGLLDLAARTQIEVRVLSSLTDRREGLSESAAGRVGARIWVVLAPDDPLEHQAQVLARALSDFRGDFLEANYVTPAIRDFIERVDLSGR